IVRSPRSYNSQVGVPLSVWQMSEENNLAIFEAGISMPGEMDALQKIIEPAIGVLTNIGDAHNEGFINNAQKLKKFTQLNITYKEIKLHLSIPFTDSASIENAITCACVLLQLGTDKNII